MPLAKTTILSPGDTTSAQQLRDLIQERVRALLVVLGAGEGAETFATIADGNAGTAAEPYWVVWARQPDGIKPVLDELQVVNAASLRGFTVSLERKVVETFPLSGPIPDDFKILAAFQNALAAK